MKTEFELAARKNLAAVDLGALGFGMIGNGRAVNLVRVIYGNSLSETFLRYTTSSVIESQLADLDETKVQIEADRREIEVLSNQIDANLAKLRAS